MDDMLEMEYEDRTYVANCDDLETYNQNEADDYRNEGDGCAEHPDCEELAE